MFSRISTNILANAQRVRHISIFKTGNIKNVTRTCYISTPTKTNNKDCVFNLSNINDTFKKHGEEISTFFKQGKYKKLIDKLEEIRPIIEEIKPELLPQLLEYEGEISKLFARECRIESQLLSGEIQFGSKKI